MKINMSIFLLKFIISIFILISTTESARCSKKCVYNSVPLNGVIPTDFCPSVTGSNNDTNQDCVTKLNIDFSRNIYNGSFESKPTSSWPEHKLNIITSFSLESTSIIINIRYVCSSTDYCDLDFIREILSSSITKMDLQIYRQTLVGYLYNSKQKSPLQCSNEVSCSQTGQMCYATYTRENATYNTSEQIATECSDVIGPLNVIFNQSYTPQTEFGLTNNGSSYCNVPDCANSRTVNDIFRWLAADYVLPVNVSILNIETPKTTSAFKPTLTTTRPKPTFNSASSSRDSKILIMYSIASVLLASNLLFQ